MAPPIALAPAGLIQQTLAETGFDLETGRVLDAAKLQRWRQQAAAPAGAGRPSTSNASLLEAFRDARRAIEAWVDDDSNRDLVANAPLEQIHGNPGIQAVFAAYAYYGAEMNTKLKRHLDFMVENRRKYYRALARTPSQS